MLPPRQNKREAARLRIRYAAEVLFGARGSHVRRVTCEICEGSARLDISNCRLVFTLRLSTGCDSRRQSGVVRSDRRYVGVNFL